MNGEMDNGTRDDELLKQLDDALAQRAAGLSEQRGLGTRVMVEIETRERARRWLNENGSLFGTFSTGGGRWLSEATRLGSSALGRLAVDVAQGLCSSRIWTTTGAVLGGGMVGWLLGKQLPMLGSLDFPQLTSLAMHLESAIPELLPVAGLSILLGVLGAAAAAFATQWQHIREYYS